MEDGHSCPSGAGCGNPTPEWETFIVNRDDIKLALLQQVPCLVVCALVLDGGGVAQTCLKALIVFWVVVGLSVVVLHEKDKLWLRRFLRWGFFPMFAVAWCVFPPEPLRVPVPHRRGTETAAKPKT